MTLDALAGITSATIPYHERIRRIIHALGGVSVVSLFIPYTHDEVKAALERGDEHLNSLPLYRWDLAAGFRCNNATGQCYRTNAGLWQLYRDLGVDCVSCSDGVSILKEAARMIALSVID